MARNSILQWELMDRVENFLARNGVCSITYNIKQQQKCCWQIPTLSNLASPYYLMKNAKNLNKSCDETLQKFPTEYSLMIISWQKANQVFRLIIASDRLDLYQKRTMPYFH